MRALDPVDPWLLPVVRTFERSPAKSPSFQHLRWHGVEQTNLRLVDLDAPALEVSDPFRLRLCLINGRSVANKTFILKEFFTSHVLDFLFLTETWIPNS